MILTGQKEAGETPGVEWKPEEVLQGPTSAAVITQARGTKKKLVSALDQVHPAPRVAWLGKGWVDPSASPREASWQSEIPTPPPSQLQLMSGSTQLTERSEVQGGVQAQG